MNPLLIVAYVLILVSALFKGLALKELSAKNRDAKTNQKKYAKLNIICYALLLPGVILWAVVSFVL